MVAATLPNQVYQNAALSSKNMATDDKYLTTTACLIEVFLSEDILLIVIICFG